MISKADTTILLIGGLAMKADEHEPLAAKLRSNAGRRTLYFDNINVGDGPRIESPKELAILDQAIYQWEKVNEAVGSHSLISIYGISMGGMIAATMATLFPNRITKLVLAATSANLSTNPSVTDDLYNNWIDAKSEEDIRTTTKKAFGKTTLNTNPQIYEDYFQYRLQRKNKQKSREFIQQLNSIRSFNGESIYSNLAKFNLPTTIITGAEDTLFDNTHKNDIGNLIPESTFIELEKTGHMLHLENLNNLFAALYEQGLI